MARHPEVQEKLRSEIKDNLGSKRDYEIIADLPYLNACIHGNNVTKENNSFFKNVSFFKNIFAEILRFFPVVFFAYKICTESIELTNKNCKTYRLPKGFVVIVPHYAIMMDENIYEKPFEFQPERFLEENGGVKKYFDMGAYWGYGDGPRICLGIVIAI